MLKSEQYRAEYCCLLQNKSNQRDRFFIVLPIPQNNTNQQILQESTFSIKPSNIGFDHKYKNKYGVWEVVLGAGESAEIRENFVIEIKSARHKIENRLSIENYNRDEEYKNYVGDNCFINVSDDRVADLARRIVKNEKRVAKIIKRINNYIVNNLRYGEPIAGLYTAIQAIEKDFVDCGGFGALFVAICAASGIPARIVSGFWAGYDKNTMHAWVEVLLPNKKWIPADPAVEQLRMQGRTKKFGKIGFVGSDRILLSVGCDIPILIKKKEYRAAILQNPFVAADKGEASVDTKAMFITQIL